ncbi:MAG: hypothetical protein HQL27_03770 [Candidatus Omnitrophica bacterium]|nr:hypothetical protein [Candidatus Omnitrophota bacterium]
MLFFAGIPNFLLKLLIDRKKAKLWIYLGQDHKRGKKLSKFFGKKAEEVDYSKELYRISGYIRNDFIKAIDDVSFREHPNPEWLFSAPSVKNPYSSRLFLNICYFFAFKRTVEEKRIDIIFVDSPALIKFIADHFKNKYALSKISAVFAFMEGIRKLLFVLLKIFMYAADKISRLIAVRIVLGKRNIAEFLGKEVVFIRSYISGEFTPDEDNIMETHFFPGLYSFLKSQGKNAVYLPVILKNGSYQRLFKNILDSGKKIFLIEEALCFSDYLMAIPVIIKSLFVKAKNLNVGLFNFKDLCNEDYANSIANQGFLDAHLYARFAYRLKKKNIGVNCLINWSEFQDFEKGLIFGIRKYYPQAKVIGSQPFIGPVNHLSLFPSRQDSILKIIPDRFLVLGNIYQRYLNSLSSEINAEFTPAFRYEGIFKPLSVKEGSGSLIVLTGYGIHNTLRVFELLSEVKDSLKSFSKILIKLHPASGISKRKIERLIRMRMPREFVFIDGRLEDYLPDVKIGICGATGTAVELVCRGIPVLHIADKRSLTMNYLVLKEDPLLWKLCFNSEDLSSGLIEFGRNVEQKKGLLEQKALEFRNEYFARPDESYWKDYIIN